MDKYLIVYHYIHEYPVRSTIRDHLYSFSKYSKCTCYYYNAGFGFIPKYLLRIKFDLIIFHTTFLSCRWGGSEYFQRQVKKVIPLKSSSAIKIALPQDEFIYCDDLCNFINEFNIDGVYSVAPSTEWPIIYSTVDFERVEFHEVLTGYLDDTTLKKIKNLSTNIKERDIHIGYRAYKGPQWLGRHGFLKTQIAEVFNRYAPLISLKTDISTRSQDTILGDDWYKFLLRCKYFIGVEGGSTILDRDGNIKKRTDEYVLSNPDASFEDVEAHCFPGAEGKLQLLALSPRQLEACATKTCQILVEGKYNGILKPDIHYIELKRDFSDLSKVLEIIKQDSARKEIVENAYRDIVESGKYTYQSFVNFVLETALKNKSDRMVHSAHGKKLYFYFNRFVDRLMWARVWFRISLLVPLYKVIRRVLPENALKFVRNIYR